MDNESNSYDPEIFVAGQALDKYPCILPNAEKARFWVEYLSKYKKFIVLSKFPFPYLDAKEHPDRNLIHNVSREIEMFGIGFLLVREFAEEVKTEDYEKWLEYHDIQTDSPFEIEAEVRYEKKEQRNTWDVWSDIKVIEREGIKPEMVEILGE